MANRRWIAGAIGILAAIGFSSIGLYLLARDPLPEQQIRQLIELPYASQRPGGARLSGASYVPPDVQPLVTQPALGAAQLRLIRLPDSPTRRHLQGLVYLAAGEWQKYIELETRLSGHAVRDWAALNNLGVSYLALSETEPLLLLKALDAFEQASQLAPQAPEPLFNLVATYRTLRLRKLSEETMTRYSALDGISEWHRELTHPPKTDEAAILDQLERAVADSNPAEAQRLFLKYPELSRRAAMQMLSAGEHVSPGLLRFIAIQMESRYGDRTISAMLAPLLGENRIKVMTVRDSVRQGAELYAEGEFPESLATYAKAEKLAAATGSDFDPLWIDLNRADTQIRLGDFDGARSALSRIISIAGEREFLWLKAKALSLYGSTVRLTSSYKEMVDLLSEADRDLVNLDAAHDRIRVLYYLAAYRHYGGDQDGALRLAIQCLRLIDPEDGFRVSTLDWLIASILYRRGTPEKSILFGKESLDLSLKGPYANGIEFVASVTLAELYQAISQYDAADDYLKIATDAFQRIPQGLDRIRNELRLGIISAKDKISRQQYGEAESLLNRNLNLYSKQPFAATTMLSESLMLLAKSYSETGRMEEARRKFTEAIDVVEKDDEYLQSESVRVKFDDERRELYDSAIEFEFRNGSFDAAWSYLQRYRAKLFLEFLSAFNPNIQQTRARVDRARIQQHLSDDTQIVEYALLKDRLLIWLVTDKIFTVRSVPVSRNDLEAKVQAVLGRLRSEDGVDPLLADLGKLLIEPVSNLLDPDRTLTIIPDRALHGLPFGALKRPGTTRYLIEDFPIVVSPSLTHFLTSDGGPPRRDSVVGFGSHDGGSSEFRELSALSGIYPNVTTVIGQTADKSSFLESLSKAPVFHYAGHSATDAADPLRSSILLDGSRTGPNSVTAVDISERRLPQNSVVILSSCDSSVGNSRDGIGVRGLTSAFLIGGAGSVVGSLWPVEANSTADLMIRFHRAFVNAGMPVAEALRAAQLEFLRAFRDRSHPYYWSGFVVTGNFSALR